MTIILALLGLGLAFALIRYRETVGDMLGEADWMHAVGGIYAIVVYLAIFIILWSIAELTGTTSVLFAPIMWLLPLNGQSQV